ncbi:MAG: YifB family Mg chelatase-like AAA ATPase [Alphaproteobacteria bacterium]|nr:YifB family Mg chelatase-like AAA ATPase [Alphaproteobacteria bacterium]
MVTKVKTVAFAGINVIEVTIELHMAPGIPAFNIVGLPDKAVSESRERVRAALNNMGIPFPTRRVTVNLAPADVFKEGSHFDLGIALAAAKELDRLAAPLDNFICMGELGLDGSIARTGGVLPAVMYAKRRGLGFICPASQVDEVLQFAPDVDLRADDMMGGLLDQLDGVVPVRTFQARPFAGQRHHVDMADIRGQQMAKRAMVIAAAGGHNVLMKGPPGAGKSMLAARLPTILPPMTEQEALATSMIHSISGQTAADTIVTHRPYRAPHSSSSMVALIGGGFRARPGEVSLAHNGVLFLDELPEFPKTALEALRQPLETGEVMIARANSHVTYPARFQLIAAMNPCKCGFLGTPGHECNKAPACAADYQGRISGPMYDRIDLHVNLPPVSPMDLAGQGVAAEDSATLRGRVAAARQRMIKRYEGAGITTNAQASGKLLDQMLQMTPENTKILTQATQRYNLTARGYHRVIKLARTIADYEDSNEVSPYHLAEALNFRGFWT